MNWLIPVIVALVIGGIAAIYYSLRSQRQLPIANQKVIDEINARAQKKADEIKSAQTELRTNDEVLDYLNNLSAK